MPQEIAIRADGVSTEIRTGHFPNTCLVPIWAMTAVVKLPVIVLLLIMLMAVL
jgi:hypothetical protein